MKSTLQQLKEMNACSPGVKAFAEIVPNGFDGEWSPAMQAICLGTSLKEYLGWAVDYGLLSWCPMTKWHLQGADLQGADLQGASDGRCIAKASKLAELGRKVDKFESDNTITIFEDGKNFIIEAQGLAAEVWDSGEEASNRDDALSAAESMADVAEEHHGGLRPLIQWRCDQ